MHPDHSRIAAYVEQLADRLGDRLAFVVLFGSRARGDWRTGSDADILIGLGGEDSRRFIDRLADYEGPRALALEVFPYGKPEWTQMFADRHPLLLEAMEDGVVFLDTGAFEDMRSKFEAAKSRGSIRRFRQGWKIEEESAQP